MGQARQRVTFPLHVFIKTLSTLVLVRLILAAALLLDDGVLDTLSAEDVCLLRLLARGQNEHVALTGGPGGASLVLDVNDVVRSRMLLRGLRQESAQRAKEEGREKKQEKEREKDGEFT